MTFIQRQADRALQDRLFRTRHEAEVSGSRDKFKIKSGKIFNVTRNVFED